MSNTTLDPTRNVKTNYRVVVQPRNYSTSTQRQLDDIALNPDELSTLVQRSYNRQPGFVMVGDSTYALGNRHYVTSTLTSYGRVGNCRIVGHDLNRGHHITIWGANQEEWNGVFEIKRVVSVNEFEIDLPKEPSVTTATGSIIIYSQEITREILYSQMSNSLAGNKGLYLGNFANSGSRTSHLSSQLDLALDKNKNLWGLVPDFVFISSGINDVGNGVSFEDITNNLTSAVNRVISSNMIPIINTLFPMETSHGYYSISNLITARRVNTYIREELIKLGAVVIDANAVCLDLDNAFGEWKTGFNTDGVHPSKQGTFQVAKVMKTEFWDKIQTIDSRKLTSLVSNPEFSGTSGTVTGTGASGVAPDGYTLTASGGGSQLAVGSKGSSLKGTGESMRIAFSGAANTDQVDFTCPDIFPTTLLSEGDKVVVRIRTRSDISPTLTGLRMAYLKVNSTIDGVTNTLLASAAYFNTSAAENLEDGWDLLLETPPILITSGMTSLIPIYRMKFNSSGGPINVDLSEYNVYKVE